MTNPSKRKLEMMLGLQDAADLLRRLGDQLERGTVSIGGAEVPLEGFRSFEVSLKQEEGGIRAKVKIKHPKAGEPAPGDPEVGAEEPEVDEDDEDEDDMADPDPASGRPRYKNLKKRMEGGFKRVRKSLAADAMPEESLLRDFLRDCGLMVTYAGKGDAFYPAFTAKVEDFAAACSNGDLPLARTLAEDLKAMEDACHDRYK